MWSAKKTRPKKANTACYAEFGAVLKEGLKTLATASALPLLRLCPRPAATRPAWVWLTTRRMKEGQEAIYYITADTLAAAKNSPQLEVFKKKGIEALL